MKDTKIQWHPGFAAAIQLELMSNRDDLKFEKEYNLNTKPLEIDVLVIKKNTDALIDNEIGQIFKGHNILEYKSPEDHLNIDTFYKVGAYAGLYKSYGTSVDAIKADDITVSLIRETKPRGLFRYFEQHGCRISKPCSGIYYIEGIVLFPTQIIVTGELDTKNHVWLKALSDKLQEKQLRELLKRIRQLTGKENRELADSVLEVSIGANKQAVETLKGDENMCQALMEIMDPQLTLQKQKALDQGLKEGLEQGMKQGLQQGLQQGMQQGLQNGLQKGLQKGIQGAVSALRDFGHDDTEIRTAIITKYGLSQEEAEAYL